MNKKTCPRCLRNNIILDAISRRDNKTPICNRCGKEEILVDDGATNFCLLNIDKVFVKSLKEVKVATILGSRYEREIEKLAKDPIIVEMAKEVKASPYASEFSNYQFRFMGSANKEYHKRGGKNSETLGGVVRAVTKLLKETL